MTRKSNSCRWARPTAFGHIRLLNSSITSSASVSDEPMVLCIVSEMSRFALPNRVDPLGAQQFFQICAGPCGQEYGALGATSDESHIVCQLANCHPQRWSINHGLGLDQVSALFIVKIADYRDSLL
jgi:hypothetical protein